LAGFVTVATVDQLPPGERIVAEIGELYVVVFNVGGNFYAIEDACTHDQGPLAEGHLHEDSDNPKIECDRHGATFELKTGKPTFPAVVPVLRFPVQVVGTEVQVDIDEPLA
jgi:3-phenylpropionate/trans-cinnamate dioxygenase ferredoxin subunit